MLADRTGLGHIGRIATARNLTMAQPTSAYDFYYWPLPFRGQFIRALLA